MSKWACLVALTTFAGTASAGGIVPDGGTPTSISTAANGHQTVNLAPAFGGVSNNTYSSFNVSKAGADLNNVGVNARTIVNQVTSTNPSLIQGAISVLGPRANVILANPNGITVDGGSFVNAGHVVLTTGQVSFDDLTPAPGIIQRNVVLTTRAGTIAIGAGGLAGTLINLDLIAKQLAVNGPVTNSFTSSSGGVRAIVGAGTTTYDTSFSPSDNTHDWLISSTSPASTSNAIAIDIGALGVITAGNIQLVVNDKGAGVRSAGKLYANAGDAVVQANGDIKVTDGLIVAANDVQLTAPGAASFSGSQIVAGHDVDVSANGIGLSDDATGPSTINAQTGSVNLKSTADITNLGSLIQAGSTGTSGASNAATGGDVTLTAIGKIDSDSDGSNQATIFATNVAQLSTPGAVSLSSSNLTATHNVSISANGISLTDGAAGALTVASQTGSIALTSTGDISNLGSSIQAGSVAPDGTATGGDIVLSATGSITNRSSAANIAAIFAANGAATLKAQGDIVNENSRILANGALTLAAQGDVQNIIDHTGGTNSGQPLAYSHQGGSFVFFTHTTSGFDVDYGTVSQPGQLAFIASTGNGGAVSISGRNVTNSGGVIQSNDSSVTIAAKSAFLNAAVFAGQASYSRSCWIFCHASASSDVAPYGGTIQSGTNLSITAGTTASNIGGNVFALGNIAVNAPVTYATGVTGYSAINQDRGFKAFFGSTWAQIIATDIGGGFSASGVVSLTGDALIDGGFIHGAKGVSAAGTITTVRAPTATPVQIGQHLGLSTWIGF